MNIVTDLKPHIRRLAVLEESASPVISLYLNLETGPSGYWKAFGERTRLLRASVGAAAPDVADALWLVEDFIRTGLLPEAKGAAIFARGGAEPFFLPLQFRVPLPNGVAVGSTPNIYHLVELKDTYDRFVFLIATEARARIVEVNLGAVTLQLCKERPELRKRMGREWTKAHYQSHRRERSDRFAKEAIGVLDRLMSAGGHTHLFLAGNPRATARVRDALPRHLVDKLVDSLVASSSDRLSDVVDAMMSSFVEQEELESQAVVEQLRQEVHANGLAVVGARDTLTSLRQSAVDVLVLASAYEGEAGWSCTACGAIGVDTRTDLKCSACGAQPTRVVNLKEEMVRLAEKAECHVEVVSHSDALMQFGGVGALLRFMAPDAYGWNPILKRRSA